MADRLAVVLFNLGGPDTLEAVQPFLANLFNDPAIISVPKPFRWLLSRLIARRRAPVAREIYARIGGASPILPETQAQALALQAILTRKYGPDTRVFVCMRYWTPRAAEVVSDLKRYAPDRIILIPLYPQMSTTTTASSFGEWTREVEKQGLNAKTAAVCCYPDEPGFMDAQVEALRKTLGTVPPGTAVRVLFSAHGLPQRIVERGDPYPDQVARTAAAIVRRLGHAGLDWVICYQSRVGPLKWIGPSTEEELHRAARDGVGVIVLPVAFVSEHSETLVELDIEYARLAATLGITVYKRVPAVGAAPAFIEGLANLVEQALTRPGCTPGGGQRVCPAASPKCLSGMPLR